MNKKEQFYKDSLPFFEAELLKEIYSTENLTICNLANRSYCVFNYIKTPDGQIGLIINPADVKQIVKDQNFYNYLVNELQNRNLLNQRMFGLNNKCFEIMKNMKKQTDLTGPTNDIDFQMEEEIMAKYKSR